MDVVIDSLVATGMEREVLERLRGRLASGEIGAFFGGGAQAQQRGGFAERPGEGPLPRRRTAAVAAQRDTARAAAAERRAGELQGEAGGDVEVMDPSFVQDFVRLTRLPGQGGGGGGGFGGQRPVPLVATGDYLVTLELGGQRQRQVLRVERVGPAEGVPIATAPQLP